MEEMLLNFRPEGKMKRKEGYFERETGKKVYWRAWLPEKEPKGVLIINHGWAEHSGRYENVAQTLVPDGFAIYAEDHRGHGKSDGKRSYVDRFATFIEDIHYFRKEIVEKEQSGLPIFMLGHSMGSVITMNYLEKYAQGLNAVVLSGTGAGNGEAVSGFLISLAKILGFLLPKLNIDAGLDPQFISHDEKTVQDYIDDPYRFSYISTRLAAEMYRGLEKGVQIMKKLQVPLLIQYGKEDSSFSGQEALFALAGSSDKKLLAYDNARHEVYNEVEEIRRQALNDLLNWLNDHLN
jgi:acylglycerol lipase